MVHLLHVSSRSLLRTKEQFEVQQIEWVKTSESVWSEVVTLWQWKVIMYWWLTGKRKKKWGRERKRGRRLSTHSPGNKVLSRKQRWLPGRWITLWGGRWGLELLHINHWARTLWKIPAVLMEKRRRGPWLERGWGGPSQRHLIHHLHYCNGVKG